MGEKWVDSLLERFKPVNLLHRLEVTSKYDRPSILVRLTQGGLRREINVADLSDGQKATILLTIALLGESKKPLLIDQPEDDLDNAFIFSSVVQTLRRVKERRQVVLVTHNANIAVLGDSELIVPLFSEGNVGKARDIGSIDHSRTKRVVQEVLEGGEHAFRRRQVIYGH